MRASLVLCALLMCSDGGGRFTAPLAVQREEGECQPERQLRPTLHGAIDRRGDTIVVHTEECGDFSGVVRTWSVAGKTRVSFEDRSPGLCAFDGLTWERELAGAAGDQDADFPSGDHERFRGAEVVVSVRRGDCRVMLVGSMR